MNKVFVISGHSGAGKTTIAYEVLEKMSSVKKVVTCTTRKIRDNEKDGVDYNFVSKEVFEQWIKKDKLIEYEKYAGNYYGSLKEDVDKIIKSKKNPMFVVETKGALTFKEKFDNSVLIFIKAPSLIELSTRLKGRGENDELIQKRLAEVSDELVREKEFDFVVINDSLKKTVEEVINLIKKETK
jgi:guanylate kinase